MTNCEWCETADAIRLADDSGGGPGAVHWLTFDRPNAINRAAGKPVGSSTRIHCGVAVEWARFGINVNATAPGALASEMMDGMLSRMGDITRHYPRQRPGDPAQLDSTLLLDPAFLAGPASDAVTATCIRVDGQHRRPAPARTAGFGRRDDGCGIVPDPVRRWEIRGYGTPLAA